MQIQTEVVSETQLKNMGLPTHLTQNGIKQLITASSRQESSSQQYILQVIKIAEDCNENKLCYLSDGFCYAHCMLSGEAKIKNIKGDLEVFDVVKLFKEDVIVLNPNNKNTNIIAQLCNVNVLGMRLLCTIGEPVAYSAYAQNEWVNEKGSNRISDGRKIQHTQTIAQLLSEYPHIPTKWILKAKIVKKHDNINMAKPFLVIKLMDDNQQTIQGVFFGNSALEAHKKLVFNKSYLFSNGQIKNKRNGSNEFQIKFTQQSQILPIEMVKTSKQQQNNDDTITVQQIMDSQIDQGKAVNLTAKVLNIKNMSKGRSLDVVDCKDEPIQIMLWDQIKDLVEIGITYVFEGFRVKVYNQIKSLQSIRNKSKVVRSYRPIESTDQSQVASKVLKVAKVFQDDKKISSIESISNITLNERRFQDVNGYLIINTKFMDMDHFFKIECKSCFGKQINFDPLCCRKCGNEPSITWNIRCVLIDEKSDLKCVINEELCRNLMGMTAIQGFRTMVQGSDILRKKMCLISHVEGIFKVKINPYKQKIFYNIIEIYKPNSTAILKKQMKELQQARQTLNI